jgi:hypothetical protein
MNCRRNGDRGVCGQPGARVAILTDNADGGLEVAGPYCQGCAPGEVAEAKATLDPDDYAIVFVNHAYVTTDKAPAHPDGNLR